MSEVTYQQAINQAISEEMARDQTVILFGEDVYQDMWGTHTGLKGKFGPDRIRDTPISEDAIVGAAVGAALCGYRPIADIMFADFLYIAGDEIMNHASKWRFEHGGKVKVPLVIKTAIGGYATLGPSHSQTLEGFLWHAPGLKIAIPSTPYDAKGLFKSAVRDNNPVVYLYHKALLGTKGEIPEEEYTIPLGVADIKRKGSDVTVIATSYMVNLALEVAGVLQQKGISVEVIDPRTLEPLDIDTIVTSVKKTKRAVIVDEDVIRCGVTGEIGMQIIERAFDFLKAPIQRVAIKNTPIPGGYMEKHVLPQKQDIADAIGKVLGMKEQLTIKDNGPKLVVSDNPYGAKNL